MRDDHEGVPVSLALPSASADHGGVRGAWLGKVGITGAHAPVALPALPSQLIFIDLPMLLTAPTAESFAEENEESHDEGKAREDQASFADGFIVILEGILRPLGTATIVS